MFKYRLSYIFLLIVIGYGVFLIYYHFCPLKISSYTICTSKLKATDSLKIVQLSDLHGNEFSGGTSHLTNKIKKLNPDIIVITGDLINVYDYSPNDFLNLFDTLQAIAPTYLVYGNHEVFLQYDPKYLINFEENISESDVTLLGNQNTQITLDSGSKINLIGITDPVDVNALSSTDTTEFEHNSIQSALQTALTSIDKNTFSLLLAHRPEYFKLYSNASIDLILSGHTHGGLVYLPPFGGLYASNQGFFPKYSAGLYHLNESQMIVSRGLGNSSKAIRIFNGPELVSITIKGSSK